MQAYFLSSCCSSTKETFPLSRHYDVLLSSLLVFLRIETLTGNKQEKSPLGKLTSEKIPTPIVFLDFFLARVPNSGCRCTVWVYSNRKGDSIFIYSSCWQPPPWVGAQDFWSQPWHLSFLDVGVQKVPVSLPEWGLHAAASSNNRSAAGLLRSVVCS